MFKQFTTALSKALGLLAASINKAEGLTKPCHKFLCWLFACWWMLPVRYNFLNLSRYSGYSEKAMRIQFSRKLSFVCLFQALFAGLKKKACVAAFDPTYLSKSGEKTYGVGLFWSGSDSRVKKGLEAGCLAIIDAEDRTAYSLEVVQTPADTEKLMEHYAGIITQRKQDIIRY